jgi:DNA ligase (NAD+)
VIPKIADVDLSRRPADAVAYAFPTLCPDCGSEAIREPGDAVRRCTGGLVCPAQAVERLRHFVSRAAFDIEGLGAKIIEEFHQLAWIRSPADIFDLEERDRKGPQGSRARRDGGRPHPRRGPDRGPRAARRGAGARGLGRGGGRAPVRRAQHDAACRPARLGREVRAEPLRGDPGAAADPASPAHLRARHPPRGRGRGGAARQRLRHLGGLRGCDDRRDRGRGDGVGRAPLHRRRGRGSRHLPRHHLPPGGGARLDRPPGGASRRRARSAPHDGRQPRGGQDHRVHRHAREDDAGRGQGAGGSPGREGRGLGVGQDRPARGRTRGGSKAKAAAALGIETIDEDAWLALIGAA